jgi:hypothetical protein
MIAGKHFPTVFRPSYDPECLLSGHEAQLGLTYTNSKRDWPSESLYQDACHRLLPPDDILRIAPRRLVLGELTTVPTHGEAASPNDADAGYDVQQKSLNHEPVG